MHHLPCCYDPVKQKLLYPFSLSGTSLPSITQPRRVTRLEPGAVALGSASLPHGSAEFPALSQRRQLRLWQRGGWGLGSTRTGLGSRDHSLSKHGPGRGPNTSTVLPMWRETESWWTHLGVFFQVNAKFGSFLFLRRKTQPKYKKKRKKKPNQPLCISQNIPGKDGWHNGTINWNRSVLIDCLLSQKAHDSIMWLKTLPDGFFSKVLKIFSRTNLYVYCANTVSCINGSIGQKLLRDSEMVSTPQWLARLCWTKETLYVVLGFSLFQVGAFILQSFHVVSVEDALLLWLAPPVIEEWSYLSVSLAAPISHHNSVFIKTDPQKVSIQL